MAVEDGLCGPGTTVVALLDGVDTKRWSGRTWVPDIGPCRDLVARCTRGRADRRCELSRRSRCLKGVLVRRLPELLAGSSCRVELTDDFVTASWHKLLQNAAAAIMALTGRT